LLNLGASRYTELFSKGRGSLKRIVGGRWLDFCLAQRLVWGWGRLQLDRSSLGAS